MKVGSIVAIKPGHKHDHPNIVWMPVTDGKTPYVIREIVTCSVKKSYVAYFEEGIIGYSSLGIEIGILLESLIELLPPEDISEEIKNIQENYQLQTI